jgi:hypothetical protein
MCAHLPVEARRDHRSFVALDHCVFGRFVGVEALIDDSGDDARRPRIRLARFASDRRVRRGPTERLQSGGGGRPRARVRPQLEGQHRRRHRSDDVQDRRALRSRPAAAARGSVLRPADVVGRERPREHADSDRPAHPGFRACLFPSKIRTTCTSPQTGRTRSWSRNGSRLSTSGMRRRCSSPIRCRFRAAESTISTSPPTGVTSSRVANSREPSSRSTWRAKQSWGGSISPQHGLKTCGSHRRAEFYVADMTRAACTRTVTFAVTGFVPTGMGARALPEPRLKLIYVTNAAREPFRSSIRRRRRAVDHPEQQPGHGWCVSRRHVLCPGATPRCTRRHDERTAAGAHVGAEPHGLCVFPQPGRYSLGHTGIFR